MNESSCDEVPVNLHSYIQQNPSSPLSAEWVSLLPDEEQGECIAKMIENAVFYETWLSYLNYAEEKGVAVTNDIIFEAIQDVGLDPFSAPLWLQLIDLVRSEDQKRELFHLALRVPLYEQGGVYKMYMTFETETEKSDGTMASECPSLSDFAQYTQVLKVEPTWPDRFIDVQLCADSQRRELVTQWNTLLSSMLQKLDDTDIQRDVQLKRIDLAFRQLCSQFSNEEVCCFAYACFLAVDMNDSSLAKEILASGISLVPPTAIALQSLNALISDSNLPLETGDLTSNNSRLLQQRLLANSLRESLVNRKKFRDIGKTAVAEGVIDWRIYHQWASAERLITHDFQMASKVYERGVSCVSKSVKDAVLLSNEASKHHLWRREEREVLGYAERQVELLSSSHHEGLKKASWNHLVHVELLLDLPSLAKTLRRRAEHVTDSAYQSFIERYRVGNYIPCSSEDLEWLEFVEDLSKARKEDQEPTFENSVRLKNVILSPHYYKSFSHPQIPDSSQWNLFELPVNREHSSINQDSDEVVGPRTMRGRLVYKMRIDEKTEARLRREERAREVKEGTGGGEASLGSGNSALQKLVKRLESRKWNETQLRLCRNISIDWIMNTLTAGELDLTRRRK